MNWFRGFPSLPAIIGLVTGSALTLLLWQHADQRAGLESERGFAQRVEHAGLALERVNAEIFSMLRSVRTLAERDGLTSQAFAATVSAANQRHFASGLQYVGFLAARAAAGSDCAPYAPGAACLTATMAYPLATNQQVMTFDMSAHESRREAIQRAVDSGYVALTRPVAHAVDNIGEPGLLAYLPVYRLGLPLVSVDARRSALIGVAVASYSLEFLVRSELGRAFLEAMDIEIRDLGLVASGDGTAQTATTTVLASASLRRTLDDSSPEVPTGMQMVRKQKIAGRTWEMRSTDRLTTGNDIWDRPGSFIVLLGGLLTLLLTLFLQGLAGARERAEELARRMTSSLRTREAQLHQALDAASMGSWQWDARSARFSFDERAGALLALQDGNLKTLFSQIHRRDRRMAQQAFKRAANEGLPFLAECRLAARTDGVLWIELSARLTLDDRGRIARVSGLVRDITERNELAAARRRLLHKLVNAEEKERRRIARELHDQLGQEITAIILGLRNLESLSPDSPKHRELLDKLRSIVHGIDNRVDKFMLDLRPVVLDELGLEAALTAQFAQWTDLHDIPVNSHVSGLSRVKLPFEVATTVFRVVQESLTNVAKHSKASSVDVIVELNQGNLTVVVEDNGIGSRSTESPHSYGLAGIQERVESLGGTFRYESRPGQGFSIFVRVPASLQSIGSEIIAQAV